jgi:hypothetical protein
MKAFSITLEPPQSPVRHAQLFFQPILIPDQTITTEQPISEKAMGKIEWMQLSRLIRGLLTFYGSRSA